MCFTKKMKQESDSKGLLHDGTKRDLHNSQEMFIGQPKRDSHDARHNQHSKHFALATSTDFFASSRDLCALWRCTLINGCSGSEKRLRTSNPSSLLSSSSITRTKSIICYSSWLSMENLFCRAFLSFLHAKPSVVIKIYVIMVLSAIIHFSGRKLLIFRRLSNNEMCIKQTSPFFVFVCLPSGSSSLSDVAKAAYFFLFSRRCL